MIWVFMRSSSGCDTGLRRFVLANIASLETVCILVGHLYAKNLVIGSFGGACEAHVTVCAGTMGM